MRVHQFRTTGLENFKGFASHTTQTRMHTHTHLSVSLSLNYFLFSWPQYCPHALKDTHTHTHASIPPHQPQPLTPPPTPLPVPWPLAGFFFFPSSRASCLHDLIFFFTLPVPLSLSLCVSKMFCSFFGFSCFFEFFIFICGGGRLPQWTLCPS